MGRDKALLPWKGSPLIASIASKVRDATGSVTLIGNPARLGGLGYPVLSDLHPGCGPMGGLETALKLGGADWSLVTACDMPRLSVESLRLLAERTLTAPEERGCVVPLTKRGWQPLCAVYHVSCLPVVEQAIALNRLRMLDLITLLQLVPVSLEPSILSNVNTPEEWEEVLAIGQ